MLSWAWLLVWGCGGGAPSGGFAVTPSEGAAPLFRAEGAAELRGLGGAPLCEPSGAVVAESGALLVVDNEVDGLVMRFALAEDGWAVPAGREASVLAGAPEDAEALARVGEGLVLVGSLSRNKRCERQAERERWLWADAEGRQVLRTLRFDVAGMEASQAGCEGVVAGARAGELCEVIVRAAAEAGPGRCRTLNVEGAVEVGGRLWVGLRAPLLGEDAVLLRLAEGGEARFDGLATVALGGRGLRELGLDAGGALHGVAGPVEDEAKPWGLVRLEGLAADAQLSAAPVSGAPDGAEGLWWAAGGVFAVLDGARGGKGRCAVEGRQVKLHD